MGDDHKVLTNTVITESIFSLWLHWRLTGALEVSSLREMIYSSTCTMNGRRCNFPPLLPGLSLAFNQVRVVRFQELPPHSAQISRSGFLLFRKSGFGEIQNQKEMWRCIGHRSLGAILHAEQSTMWMSKLPACPNSLQEPSSCVIFHLELTSPCKPSLLYNLTGFNWILRKRDLAAMRNHMVRPGSSQSQGCSNLEQGTWIQRTGRTAYPESLQ